MQSHLKYDILGIGAPVMDHLVKIEPEFLDLIPGENYGAELIDYKALIELITKTHTSPVLSPGGSCANVIRALAHFGHKCAMLGKIGHDKIGFKLTKHMNELGIETFFHQSQTPTTHVACFITPDGKRTMRGFMGASQELNESEIEEKVFRDVKLVHIGGYTLFNEHITEKAIKLAKQNETIVSFDLGSFELVQTYRQRILALLPDVDILFGNKDEMHALTLNDLEYTCKSLKKICNYVIIMLAEKGCMVGHQNETLIFEGYPVKHPLDTTGAGDLFASGFLHGILTDQSPNECARLGSLTGSEIVQVIGTELPSHIWKRIK